MAAKGYTPDGSAASSGPQASVLRIDQRAADSGANYAFSDLANRYKASPRTSEASGSDASGSPRSQESARESNPAPALAPVPVVAPAPAPAPAPVPAPAPAPAPALAPEKPKGLFGAMSSAQWIRLWSGGAPPAPALPRPTSASAL